MVRKIKILCVMCVIMLCFINVKSNAAVQSNGNTPASYPLDTWMKTVRDMETTGGGLGLTETLKADLTSNSGSNNLDIHMIKNTEYGATAILSASSYGNPNKINDGDTTTGNKSGIVIRLNQESVAAGTVSKAPVYYGANAKYKNVQTGTYVRQKGDAITETNGWHGSTSSQWIFSDGYKNTAQINATLSLRYSNLLRAYSGSIFSYYGYGRDNGGYDDSDVPLSYGGVDLYDAYYTKKHPTRAIMVVGEGI